MRAAKFLLPLKSMSRGMGPPYQLGHAGRFVHSSGGSMREALRPFGSRLIQTIVVDVMENSLPTKKLYFTNY